MTIEFSDCRIELKFLVKQDSVSHYEFVSNNEDVRINTVF